MEKGGFATIEKQIPELFKMLGRQTTQRIVHDFLRNEPQMFGERGRMMKGLGVEGQLAVANATDYERNMHNITEAWKEMMGQIGLPLTKAAIPILQSMSKVFLDISKMAHTKEGAENITAIAKGLGILGGALMGGGAIAMLAALGPVGWLAAGLTALGVAAITYKDPIMAWLENMRKTNWNEVITKALAPIVSGIRQWFLDLPGMVMDAMKGMWEDLKGQLKNLISYTGGGFGGGGGGLINAAWSGGGGGSGRAIGGSPHGAYLQYAGLIKQYGGDEAENMMKIYRTEGPQGYAVGDHGMAFGPFQANIGRGRIGDQMMRAGINVRDPKSLKAQIEWMKNYGHRMGGYSDHTWFGLRDKGVGSLRSPRRAPDVHEHHIYLDGEPIHRAVVQRIVNGMKHPMTAPYHDGSRHWTPPDAGLVGV
jgi:hypothetical protein